MRLFVFSPFTSRFRKKGSFPLTPIEGIWDLSFEEAHPMFEHGDRQIVWRAHLLRGHQDWDEAQRGDERLRGEMRNLEEKLSRVSSGAQAQ